MAIEKSQILINNMPEEAFVIGTDFNEQTLIDKKLTLYFLTLHTKSIRIGVKR